MEHGLICRLKVSEFEDGVVRQDGSSHPVECVRSLSGIFIGLQLARKPLVFCSERFYVTGGHGYKTRVRGISRRWALCVKQGADYPQDTLNDQTYT
jgi:hypothetical protein